MYKRTLKALLVVAALGVAFPLQAAARPNDSGGSMVNQRGTLVVHQSAPIVSEKTAGLNLPTQQQPVERVLVSSDTGFDWGDAGIGAAVMFGSILAAVAAAGMVRRHQGHFAH